ncbi:rifin PIR protein, putative [Plasmodium sp. gorilla clade G2]|uniref:rifin PIR protein, putative n=1 Tax=Plasmodium sp. gorilla clade G2 TaxID=880535 RepID=UPI000D2CB35C|nr:rifin PIR protein, putative [Plasmodium sp. gorilla clade G2]SOV20389.1 rifin PIR protein, putative [Plasmodium sp. gorilla clade G2]
MRWRKIKYHIIILFSYNYLTAEVLHINENEAQNFKMLLCLFLLNKLLLLLLLLPLLLLLLSCRQFQRNGYMSPHIIIIEKISRALCEYDIYTPNYDNDPEMKEVIEKYNERLEIRWKKYYELKKERERKYKEKYDKDIKEIILKDKIQKQLTKQLSALEKFTDMDDLDKGINEKEVASKVKKGKKSKKTLGHNLSEWNILPNIDMHEWIRFSSKEAKSDCNIKNMKHALTKVGYVGTNKFTSIVNRNGKVSVDMAQLFSSITSSSNAFIQRYMGDDFTSNGNKFKSSSVSSIFIYALWEFFEHIVAPVSAALFFKSGDTEGGNSQVTQCSGGSSHTAHGQRAHVHGADGPYYMTVLYDSFVTIYTIASILLIIYYILKYYRNLKVEKRMKYIKLLKE